MEEHGQLKVYEEIELPLLYVLADMEQAGIAVSDAVSYTHLALFRGLCELLIVAFRAGGRTHVPGEEAVQSRQNRVTVSYTHLAHYRPHRRVPRLCA